MKVWKAAIYARLSRDDENYCSESVSIKNQKAMIFDFLDNHPEIMPIDTYIDDGFTGTNFDRPGFSDMMFDINIGRVNCVIVKDLSRLGRNTARVSELKDEIFPSKGVRFIAINDNVDTKGGIDDNDVTDFKLVCNEYYVKDISKKIRTSLRASAKQGLFMGSQAPYGYNKSSEDKHKLVIDEESANVVRRIFTDFIDGKSGREIADRLNIEGVLSPLAYRNSKNGKPSKQYAWTSHTIYEILKNEVYFGNMVQHKRENVSYKLKQRRFVDEKEQIVVLGTHKAIISENTEQIVKTLLKEEVKHRNRKRLTGEKLPILFSGLLICADCGGKLAATTKHNKRCYRCAKYNNSGNNTCSSHYITEEKIIETVNRDLNFLYKEYEKDDKLFFDKIMKNAFENQINETNKAKVELVSNNKRLSKIEDIMAQLYNDKMDKVITSEMFSLMSKKYNDELNSLLQEINRCDKIINKSKVNEIYINEWIKTLLDMKYCNALTSKDYAAIIDKIYVNAVGSSNRLNIKYKIGFLSDEFLNIKAKRSA